MESHSTAHEPARTRWPVLPVNTPEYSPRLKYQPDS